MLRITSRLVPLLALAIALPVAAQLADGDRHWQNRAQPGQIDAAINAYQRAVAANGSDVEAHARLLRALRFKGAYVAKSVEEKKRIYGVAKNAGAAAITVVEKRANVTAKSSEKEVADAIRSIPGAAGVYLWDAVNWGEWALAYGKLAAAREGAADRIRRGATIAMLVDPRLENASPSRVLGRLHDQTPRIPFLTGWASGKEALRFLNESLRLAPNDKLTTVFLAEAMVGQDASAKPKAIELLRRVVNTPNDPDYAVEEAAAVADARALLRKWGA